MRPKDLILPKLKLTALRQIYEGLFDPNNNHPVRLAQTGNLGFVIA